MNMVIKIKKKKNGTRKIIILIIAFLICMFFENRYLKDVQKSWINSYNIINNIKAE